MWELLPVRCGASNRCDYCAKMTALENALVVELDAKVEQPTVGLTTTTRNLVFDQETLTKDMRKLMRAERSLWRALRRELGVESLLPDLRYLGFLEWTTGKHTAGRRPHIHHLVKGLALGADEAAEFEARVSELWRRYTRDSWVVECRPLRTPVGAIAYLTLHHHKMEQAPPKGVKHTKRLRPSIKPPYFHRPIAGLRDEARELLADRRLAWIVEQMIQGEFVDESEEQRDDELLAAAVDDARAWRNENPPVLLRVDEQPAVDTETGQVVNRVTRIRGEMRAAA